MKVPHWLRSYKVEQYIIRRTIRNGVFVEYFKQKYIYARKLRKNKNAISKPVNHPELTVHMLLCHGDVTMALWSLLSFYKVSNVVGQLVIHSDGTLTKKDKDLIMRLIPEVIIIDKLEANELIKTSDLPDEIKNFRLTQNNVYLMKLIDTYVVSSSDYHLVIDSDLVWFSNPVEIECVILNQKRESLMLDKPHSSQVDLKGGKLLEYKYARFNGGITFFHKDDMHLEKMVEFFNMLDMTKLQRFIDQAGQAYCINNLRGLPMEKYLSPRSELARGMVMKHYTQVKREYFYIEGIRQLDVRL